MLKLLKLIDRFRYFSPVSLLAYSVFGLLSFSLFFSVSGSLWAQSQDEVIIFFDSNNNISKESIEVIERNMDALRDTPEFTITLEGYSDLTGRTDYNIELSKKRAQIVKDYLVDLGIDPDKLRVVGKGGTDKYATGETQDALQQNRRVNLIIDIPPEPEIEVQPQESEELPQTTPPPSEKPEEEVSSTDSISQTVQPPQQEDVIRSSLQPMLADLSKTIEKKVRGRAPSRIIFNTPTEMQIGKSYLVEADVAYSFIGALSEDLGDIKLDNKIGINLTGNGFDIAPELENDLNEERESENGAIFKLIDKDTSLKWKWSVTPTRDGIGSLVLSIAITVENSVGGLMIGEYATFQRVIEVRPNIIHAVTSSYWIMGVLIIFIIAVVAWFLIRKVRVY